ncbi:MAG: glycine cleavage system protein GcvH [Deferrisomatales bacterium]
MKAIEELVVPEDLRYSKDHEWARLEENRIRVGITDFAQSELGDVVFVELPEVGERFDRGDVFGSVESVKAVSELFLPVGGEIVEVNTALEDAPELINESPYDAGWIVLVRPDDPKELDDLLDREGYMDMVKSSC